MSGPIAIQVNRKRLLQNHDTFIQWVQHILNILCVIITLFVLAYYDEGVISTSYKSLAAFTLLLMIVVYQTSGVYRRFDSVMGGVRHLCRAWGLVVILLGALAFIMDISSNVYSKDVIVNWGVLSIVFQIGIFITTYKMHAWYSKVVRRKIPTIVVGTGSIARHLAERLASNIWLPDDVVGLIDSDGRAEAEAAQDKFTVLGTVQDIAEIVRTRSIKRVYVALPFSESQQLNDIQTKLKHIHVDLIWAPDIFSLNLLNHSVREVAGVPLINLNETPLLVGGPAFLKYTLDKVVSLIAIIVLSPLLLIIALIIKLTSRGPVIFKQIRDGWDGKQFYVYKFRSMYVHDEGEIVKQATKCDNRITPIGRFIRRTSIDELPQLINVLEGSMSLVGPRPHAVSHNRFYSSRVKEYLARHRIKPGMTGLAQINGLRGETDTLEAMEQRVEMDLEYIKNWSFSLDLMILIKTPLALVSKNAY